jgi:hypothetical protein
MPGKLLVAAATDRRSSLPVESVLSSNARVDQARLRRSVVLGGAVCQRDRQFFRRGGLVEQFVLPEEPGGAAARVRLATSRGRSARLMAPSVSIPAHPCGHAGSVAVSRATGGTCRNAARK